MEMPARRTHRQGGPGQDGRPCWPAPPRQGSANRPSPAPGHRAARPAPAAPGSSSAAASRRARSAATTTSIVENNQSTGSLRASSGTALLLSLDAPRMSTCHAAGCGRPVSGWRCLRGRAGAAGSRTGSLNGCQQPQSPSHAQPHRATQYLIRRHIQPCLASSSYPAESTDT